MRVVGKHLVAKSKASGWLLSTRKNGIAQFMLTDEVSPRDLSDDSGRCGLRPRGELFGRHQQVAKLDIGTLADRIEGALHASGQLGTRQR